MEQTSMHYKSIASYFVAKKTTTTGMEAHVLA